MPSAYVDLDEIARRRQARLITTRGHPRLPLQIHNYTARTQYSRAWDEYTMMCRGLVTDPEGRIVARPFRKFFNLEELGYVPDEGFLVQEKMDGSLIIVFLYEDKPVVASRGSFVSDQASLATGLLRERLSFPHDLTPGWTYCFELIHPENRIVVDYGAERNLYLLGVIDNATGNDFALSQFELGDTPIVPHYPDYEDLSRLPERDDAEGYVIRFESGLRAKVKHPRYVELHKAIFGLNEKAVWEMMRDGKSREEILSGMPDEVYDWADEVATHLQESYRWIEKDVASTWADLRRRLGDAPRKDYALAIQEDTPKMQPLLFACLSGKDYAPAIWKMIKPTTTDEEEEAS